MLIKELERPEELKNENGFIVMKINKKNIENKEHFEYFKKRKFTHITHGENSLKSVVDFNEEYSGGTCDDCDKVKPSYLVICKCGYSHSLLCKKCKDKTTKERGALLWCAW